jgi:hypothetical protein
VTYRYHSYGLDWVSDSAVPGACTADSNLTHITFVSNTEPPDWVKSARQLPLAGRFTKPHGSPTPAFTLVTYGSDRFCELTYSEGARFFVDSVRWRVWGTYFAPLSIEDFATFLLGPVFGFILRKRGVITFHASAVNIRERAILICGPQEAGKSTTAAALALRGLPVLCEDLSALENQQLTFHVQPGYPRICLWPDTVQMLFGAVDALPRLTPTWEKCYLPLDGHRATFDSRSVYLGAIYILAPRADDGTAPRIEVMNNRDALLGLVQNTYMNWLLDRNQRAAEFEFLGKLVSEVPVRRLVPHSDPARIDRLCDLILADAENLCIDRHVSAAD